MRILIAEDEPTSRRMLQAVLTRWGHEVLAVERGDDALQGLLARPDAPELAVLDWMLPGLDGPEVCRRLRQTEATTYVILLTARTDRADVITGLDAGANDYITKPFDSAELQARVNVGCRMVELQQALGRRLKELEDALEHINTLQGLIRICMHCHRILDDAETWQGLEHYIELHSGARFTHGLCPECLEQHYPMP